MFNVVLCEITHDAVRALASGTQGPRAYIHRQREDQFGDLHGAVEQRA
jgi:hypothetical protein